MTRRIPGGYRRNYRPPGGTDNRKIRRVREQRVEADEACRFPLRCSCGDCTPEVK